MKRAAQIIRKFNDEIMDSWSKTVKKEVEASRISSNLALRNQLPHVLEDIAEIMDRYEGFEEIKNEERYEEIISNSIDHGRHRAASSKYTVEQILHEYIIFHKTLTDFLRKNDAYTAEVGILLKYTLETAMLNSAGSFTKALQEMRNKLVGTLAHDIRNPVSAAYLAIEMMDYSEGEERLQRLQKLGLRSLKKSLELMEGMLDAITVKAGEGITMNFENVDLMRDVKWVYSEASEIYTNDIHIETDIQELNGIFDGTAIRRILENLVSNAVKHGAKNSAITIKVKEFPEKVSLSVHNFGNPIPQDKQEGIFDFLNSSKKESAGKLKSWGMGLTLIKAVAEAHGGSVELESNEGKGTTFSIMLHKYKNKPGKVRSKLNFSESPAE
ncbi:HAMP domain-containing sensor histidine kinase [Zunongwangia sp. F363]|uniref:histidine kinase n=1 Tax=Autumnicola tepida TaxID=3075595 RepID=A0ABU3C508_9FLAO|nr:HAMP domain-containing sensor histidine kinase [Zunongwangia sp. F363]MDT0641401.1 HAMP domain-containing sensor histidine kinase [Zunongwangia sp. F363]